MIGQIVREGARQMLAAALQAEVGAYIAQFTGERDEDGRRLVVRNGSAEPRTVLTSAGAVEVTAPRRRCLSSTPRSPAAVTNVSATPSRTGSQSTACTS